MSPDGRKLKLRQSAAAIALWAHFTDFCLEETPEEANAVAVACGAIEGGLPTLTSFAGANSSSSLNLAQHCQLALLAAVGMYQDLAELRSVEHWLRTGSYCAMQNHKRNKVHEETCAHHLGNREDARRKNNGIGRCSNRQHKGATCSQCHRHAEDQRLDARLCGDGGDDWEKRGSCCQVTGELSEKDH